MNAHLRILVAFQAKSGELALQLFQFLHATRHQEWLLQIHLNQLKSAAGNCAFGEFGCQPIIPKQDRVQ